MDGDLIQQLGAEFKMSDDVLVDEIRDVIKRPLSKYGMIDLLPLLAVLSTRDNISMGDELLDYFRGELHYNPWDEPPPVVGSRDG